LEETVGPETQLIVAHSLGTLVAYEGLCAHPEWGVTTLITIGCPLANEVVHPWLEPCPVDGRGVWPGSVRRWVNVADRNDPAAASSLADRFDGRVVEFTVDNGHRAHDPEPYLNNRWTGEAVADALRSAALGPTS
jgi:pimeloyl-ACP methyl ester carboxylesterase